MELKFIPAKQHAIDNGYYSEVYGFGGPPDNIMLVLNGNKEYVLTGASEELLVELRAIPSDSFLGVKMKDVKKYLTDKGFKFTIEGGKISKI